MDPPDATHGEANQLALGPDGEAHDLATDVQVFANDEVSEGRVLDLAGLEVEATHSYALHVGVLNVERVQHVAHVSQKTENSHF